MLITAKNFSMYAKAIAAPADPEEYNQAAVNRLMDKLDPYVIRVIGVKPQFKAINKVQLIDFQTEADRLFYMKAWERYLLEKARIEGAEVLSKAQGRFTKAQSRFNILVQFLKFRQAAELCRTQYLVDAMFSTVKKYDRTACAALNFRATITKCATILMAPPYNIPRDEISLIWGGSQVVQTKKGKIKKALLENDELLAALEAEGIDLDSIDLGDSVEVKEEVHFDPSLRMGSQNQQARQYEIDSYQRGKARFGFFTFKAGGVGLSLHHTDEFTKFKCRRKESGYVYEEDIPQVLTRPREVYCAPTYSAIELVQGLGRCPRLTSLSDTLQLLVFFRGTIEERVAAITSMKLRCLSKVVRQREHWEDMIIGRDTEAITRQIEDKARQDANDSTDEDDGIMGEDINEDENGGK